MSTIEPHTDQLNYIFNNAKVGIAICNAADNRLVLVNPAFAHIHGYEPHELIGAAPGEVFAPECMLRLSEHESSPSACSMNDVSFETTHIRKDGSPVPVSVHITVIKDHNGIVIQRIANVIDISERKKTETELQTTHERFDKIYHNSPDVIYLIEVTPEGRFIHLDINPAYVEASGMRREQIVGRYVDEIEHEAFRAILLDKYNSCFKAKTQTNYINDYPLPSGIRTFHSVLTPLFDKNGRIYQIVGIARDITEQKHAKKQLQAALEFNEEIIHTIPDLLFELDAEGNYLNIWVQDETLLAEQKEFLLGKNIREILSHDAIDVCAKTIQEIDEIGQSLGNTMYVDLPEGRKWFELSASLRKSTGTYIMLSRDITERKYQAERLERTKAKLSAVISTIPDLIWVKDAEGIYMMCNPSFERFFGAECGEIIGKTDYDFLSHEQADFFRQKDREAMEAGEMRINEEEIVFASDGRRALLETRKMPVYHDDQFMGVLGIGRDITEKKKLENLLIQNEMRLKEAQKIAKVGSWELEFPGFELSWSDEIFRIFEIDPNDFQPSYEYFLSTVHPDDRRMIDAAFSTSLKHKTPYSIEHRLLMKDGRIKYVHELGETLFDTEGNPIRSIGTVQDITERKSIEKKIEHMAHHDALTGLPNRALVKIRAEQIIANAKRNNTKSAVLFIDLDGFKEINDTLGHSTGDAMLKSVASRLKECIRENDILSRQGGDEFLVILSEIRDENDISAVAKKILEVLEHPYEINIHTLLASGSIGIALYPDHGETFETLLQCADTAMYKAKERGKNNYCFYTQQMNHYTIGQFKLQNDLKNALANNEFVLFYQPQIDLYTNRITGAEALIRWRHPQLGMVPPMQFIPVAENSGLIVQIGEWVLEEACAQAAQWHQNGIGITVAVNISAMQFKRGNLEDVVIHALEHSRLDPKFLELELTESIMMNDVESTLKTVQILKLLGISLSIDDFGTGYSSLAYLKRFSVDKLKIDQSFVRDILTDREDAAIVKAIVQMASSLSLKTVAEGVEDANVLSVIDAYGCDEVQGYHFAKPMEAAEFESYYSRFNTKE